MNNSTQSPQEARIGYTLAGAALSVVFYVLGVFALHAGFARDSWAAHVLDSWINLASIVAFGMAVAMLLSRRRQQKREETQLSLGLLGDDEEALLLPDDVRSARKHFQAMPAAQRNSIVGRLLSAGLHRARANWSADEVSLAISQQADLISSEIQASYATIRYLAWAIPSLGFIGTVLGIGQTMGLLNKTAPGNDSGSAISLVTAALSTAFDTTLVALLLSLVVMFLLYTFEADDERLLVRTTEWCYRRLPLRMHQSAGD